jgi:hypothetical protein
MAVAMMIQDDDDGDARGHGSRRLVSVCERIS